jgi:hypothetical protein
MNTQTNNIASRLLPLLQSCHSILGTAWPKPGCPQLTGARTFIGTNLFAALENGAMELDQLFAGLESATIKGGGALLWKRCHDVIKRLKVLGRTSENPHIDAAFNLLYLATGVLYRQIAHSLTPMPDQDARFATVEEIEDLAQQCQWQGNATESAGQIADALAEVLDGLGRIGVIGA